MNKNFLRVTLITFFMLACASLTPTTTVTSAPTLPSTETALPKPTSTPNIIPTATVISIPLSELPLPQIWEGTYKFNSVECGISVIIEAISGDTFTGKQVDAACDGYQEGTAIMKGQFVRSKADFVAELAKWGNLEEYETGPENGLWLKWTGTYIVGGTQSSYYYAHIREDKTMLSIRYYTEDVESLVEETLFFQLK